VDPHPEQDERPEPENVTRSRVITAVVIGGVVLVLLVLHLIGAMSLHGS
jgi:hypothetical protein